MLKPVYLTLFNFYLYFEEPWKGSVPEVYHKRTTDGSDLGVIDPNTRLCSYSKAQIPDKPAPPLPRRSDGQICASNKGGTICTTGRYLNDVFT